MKKYCIILAFIGFVQILNAQSAEYISQVFKKSYSNEAVSNYAVAITTIEKEYQKNSYELNLRLGWLYYLSGKYQKSIDYYKIAKQLMPKSIEAKLGYVLPLAALNKWDEVRKVYEEILTFDGQNSIANYRLGLLYYDKKDYKKAYRYAQKVVTLYPLDFDSDILFAWINLKLGNKSDARLLFNKALIIFPGNKSALDGLKLIK